MSVKLNTGVELNTTVVLQEVKPIAFRHCRPPRMLSVLIKTFTCFIFFSCYITLRIYCFYDMFWGCTFVF